MKYYFQKILLINFLIITMNSLIPLSAFADAYAERYFEYLSDMDKSMNAIQRLNLKEPCSESVLRNKAAEIKECKKLYQPLADKPVIKIDYVIGYSDYEGMGVADISEASATAQFLTRPCQAIKGSLCGFQQSPEDADLYIKEIPWIDGKLKKFEVRITHSSISANDSENRKSQRQKEYSELASQRFSKALQESDVVLYSGHSRFGGGPDFGPKFHPEPPQTPKQYYLKEKPGLKKMMSDLQRRKDKIFMLGMLSCDSHNHFNNDFKNSGKVSRSLLTSNLVGNYETQIGFVGMLNTILSANCDPYMGSDILNHQITHYGSE